MTNLITLTNTHEQGGLLKAVFNADKGMNLMSYSLSAVEVMAQNTLPLFNKRCAGLGALIGPHFHQNPHANLDFDLDLFPHIKPGLEAGRKDPFSHGIARYVPWKVSASSTQLEAHLDSSMTYKGVLLKTLEGQAFSAHFHARLLPTGLFIKYSLESDSPSVLGFHYYYDLPDAGLVSLQAEKAYRKQDKLIPFEKEALVGKSIHIPIKPNLDISLFPVKENENFHDYKCQLITDTYDLHLLYSPEFEHETCLQLYTDNAKQFVCLEPLSAKDPKKPYLTRSLIEMKLEIFPKEIEKK